jgi:gamma-glutamylcyclotransferase (GGCT)/AIG2-like uncharacterized protein YtfP
MKQPDQHYLFVYGTLRRDRWHEMYRLLARYADFMGDATFHGRLFLVDEFPGAMLSNSPNDVVRGEVYRLGSPDLVLERFDDYEEFDSRAPDQSLYRRELVDVLLNNGKCIHAWIYLYNRPTEDLPPIPSGDFLERGE